MDLEYTHHRESTRGLSLSELEETLIEVYNTRQEERKYLAELYKMEMIKVSA